MQVLDFDIKRGIFHFEVDGLTSNQHAHPVVEVIKANRGSFSLESNVTSQDNLTLAIVDANIKHRVMAEQGEVALLMLESNNLLLGEFLLANGIDISGGVFTASTYKKKDQLVDRLKLFANAQTLKAVKDQRVQKCLKIIETENLRYSDLTSHLTSEVCLSESRLSHLFKEHVGISAKKYLAWSRLKHALHCLLNEKVSFTQAAHQSGFFDQAHLSNAFKQFLGLSPSRVYNSRTLQF